MLPKTGEAFIWVPISPVNRTGWWMLRIEYREIIKEIFSDPGYVLWFSGDSLMKIGDLLFRTALDSFRCYPYNSHNHHQIKKFFPHEEKMYLAGKQAKNFLEGKHFFSNIYPFVFLLSIAGFLFVVVKVKLDFEDKLFLVFVGSALFFNVIIMASLSGAYDRYNSRIVWFIPMTTMIFFWKYHPYLLISYRKAHENESKQ